MHEIYLALFAHHPPWAKRLLALRERIVVPLGLLHVRDNSGLASVG
jgi:hypothetical protein